MVLTRRAYKSIVRWLPNEVLTEILEYLSADDLILLSRISRLVHGLATPPLYRSINLGELTAIEKLVSVLEKYRDSPVSQSRHVQEFSVMMIDDSPMYPDLANRITAAISNCPNLRTLQLLMSKTHLGAMLRDSHFSILRTFRYAAAPDVSTALPAFINRHQTITELDIVCGGEGNFSLAPIQLRHLTTFSGETLFIPSLICDKTLRLVCIYYLDRDFVPVLERLGLMASTEEFELDIMADRC
ncbi:hypothetical protein K438DRAFT_1999085 [Mycena galopus ATCC 62051]|nr:hypothetical protein K438DRAFT_1999085 [Mycena galopus ATCC 62051]